MCLSWHSCLESAKGKYSFFPKRFKVFLGTRDPRVPIMGRLRRRPWGRAGPSGQCRRTPGRRSATIAATRPLSGTARSPTSPSPPPPLGPTGAPRAARPPHARVLQNLTSGALPGGRVRMCMTFMPVMARSADSGSSVRVCMTTARARPVRPADRRPRRPPARPTTRPADCPTCGRPCARRRPGRPVRSRIEARSPGLTAARRGSWCCPEAPARASTRRRPAGGTRWRPR